VKLDHPFRRNAPNGLTVYVSSSGQGCSRILLSFFWRAAYSVSLVVKHDDMNINFSAIFITQYEIPMSGVFELYVGVTSLLQEVTEHRSILLLNSKVQVLIWPGLLAK